MKSLPAFIAKAQELVSRAGGTWIVAPVKRASANGSRDVDQEQLKAPNLDVLKALIATLPNSLGHDEWLELSFAVCAAGGEDAYDAWEEWSLAWADPKGRKSQDTAESVRDKWDTFPEAFIRGWPWLVEQAQQYGFDPSLAAAATFGKITLTPEQAAEETKVQAVRQSTALPDLLSGDVYRWYGIDPPDVPFVVDQLIPRDMVTLLTADGGAGKTQIMQYLITAIAAGATAYNRPTMKGQAVGIFAEDNAGVLHKRQHRINAHFKIDYPDLRGRAFVTSYCGKDARLWANEQPTPLMLHVEERLRTLPDARLLCIDNAAYVFGGEENARGEVTQFMAYLNGLAERCSVGVLLSTHTSKSDDGTMAKAASGSTAWPFASRAVLKLTVEPGNPVRTMTVIKSNHGPTDIRVRLEFKNSLLVPLDEAVANAEDAAIDDRLESLIRREDQKNTPLSPQPRALEYLPRLAAIELGISAKVAKESMERLIASRKTRVEMRNSPRRQCLVPCRTEAEQETSRGLHRVEDPFA